MIKLKDLLKEVDNTNSPEYIAFDKAARELMDIVWNRHPSTSKTKPFTKNMSSSTTKNINDLYKMDDKKAAKTLLDHLAAVCKEYVDHVNNTNNLAQKSTDDLEQRVDVIAKQQADLDDPNQQRQKSVFENTFRPILDKIKKSYYTLKDKDIVKKLDEILDVIYNNYNLKKYEQANNGCTRLIATMFPGNVFTLWNNDYTDKGLPNAKVLEMLDAYKDLISKGQ